MEWNEMCRFNPELTIRIRIRIRIIIDMDKINENGRNIYEWNPIDQTILEIDLNWTFSNELNKMTFRRLEYLNNTNF